MNRITKNILILIYFSVVFCDLNNDARMLGLSNAYTNISRGYSCIGINPANLAVSPNFTLNFGSFYSSTMNNLLSVKNYNDFSGSNMIDSTDINYYNKNQLKDLFDNKGLIISSEIGYSLPFISFSINNYAFTSKTNTFAEAGIPNLLLDLFFFGNNIGENVDFDIPYSVQSVQETGLSYASQYKNIYYGISVKHLLGLFHSDLYAIDSTYFLTDTSSFVIEGSYLLRQGLGGSGISLDVGLLTEEFYDGYQVGVSLINLFGRLNWSDNSYFRQFAEDLVFPLISDDMRLRPNEYKYYHFLVDSLTGESISSDSYVVRTTNYNVIKVDNLDDVLFNYNPDLVVAISDSTEYLVPSERMPSNYIEKYTSEDNFTTNYPTLLRLGLSRKFLNDGIVACDFTTGFSNNMSVYNKWQMNFGVEFNRFPDYPIRFGFMINDINTAFSFGSGIHKRGLKYDYAISLHDGYTLSKAKGVKFGMSIGWK